MSIITVFHRANIISHAIYYKLLKNIRNKITSYKIKKTSFDNSFSLNDMFQGLDIPVDSNIYLYAGLKHIRQLTGLDYRTLTNNICNILINEYYVNSIIVPTNTFIFRSNL